jgi:hypothetical protein
MGNMPKDRFGRFKPHEGPPAPPPGPHKQKRRSTQFKHFRVDAVLNDADRAEYEKLLAHPNTTIKQLQAFLAAKGHHVCRSAVSRHRQDHHIEFKRLREVSRMAQSFCDLTRDNGPGVIAEANHARFEMLLMESLFNVPGAKEMPPEQWERMAKTIGNAVATRRSVEEMRADYDRRAREAAALVENANKKGATGKDVVERMKEILGV